MIHRPNIDILTKGKRIDSHQIYASWGDPGSKFEIQETC